MRERASEPLVVARREIGHCCSLRSCCWASLGYHCFAALQEQCLCRSDGTLRSVRIPQLSKRWGKSWGQHWQLAELARHTLCFCVPSRSSDGELARHTHCLCLLSIRCWRLCHTYLLFLCTFNPRCGRACRTYLLLLCPFNLRCRRAVCANMPPPLVVKPDDGGEDVCGAWPAWKRTIWDHFVQDTEGQNLGDVLIQAWDGKLDRIKQAWDTMPGNI